MKRNTLIWCVEHPGGLRWPRAGVLDVPSTPAVPAGCAALSAGRSTSHLNVLERLSASATYGLGLVGLGIVVVWAGGCDPFETTNGRVDKGIAAYEAENFEEASNHFAAAKEELPESAELHYNSGTALLAQDKLEEADEALSRAMETAAGPLRTKVLANLGLARLKRAIASTDEAAKKELLTLAVEALQRCVVADPSNEEARRNLELALSYLYPTCEKREDALEPNNSEAEAKPLMETTGKELLLCPGNADIYIHDFKKGDRVTLKVQSKAAAELGAPGVRVVGADGKVVAEESDIKAGRELKFTIGAEGKYLVHMVTKDDEERPYTLELAVLPDCASMPDPFEANNSRAQAKPVEKGQAQFRVCPKDEDYFIQPLKRGESIYLQAQAQAVAGEVSVEILDAQGNVASRAAKSEGGASGGAGAAGAAAAGGPSAAGGAGAMYTAVLLDVPADGDYFIRVAGTTPESEAGVTLALAVRPPCPEGDDEMEENDGPEAAKDLAQEAAKQAGAGAGAAGAGAAGAGAQPPGAGAPGAAPMQFLLRRCGGDDDWFKLVVKPDAPQQVQIEFQHDKGDLSLHLYEEGKKEPTLESNKSSGVVNGEGVVLAPAKETTYLIRVSGLGDASNFYRLSVQPPQDQGGQNNQDNKDDQKKDEEKKQEQQPQEEKKDQKPIEQAMDQLDKQKRPNIEAQKAVQGQAPMATGKPW